MNINQFFKRNDAITLEQLKNFILVYELGSMSLTALYTHKTQPAITQNIAKLEEKLNIKLIKSSRGKAITFTEEGHRFYAQVRPIVLNLLVQIDEIENKHTVNIGVCDDLSMHIQTQIVNEVRKVINGRVRIMCDFSHKIRNMVSDGRLDFGITKQLVTNNEGIHQYGWASIEKQDFCQTQKLAIVSAHSGCFVRELVEKTLNAHNKDFYFSYLGNHVQNQMDAVLAGLGIGIFEMKTIDQYPSLICLDESDSFPKLANFNYELVGEADSYFKQTIQIVLKKYVHQLNT